MKYYLRNGRMPIRLSLMAFCLVAACTGRAQSQSIGIGTISPDTSAQLHLSSTSKGFLPPRLTTVQRDAIISPATGLMIYNTTTSSLEINTGTAQSPVWTAAGSVKLTNVSLGSSTSPAGTATGQMAYNTNAASGLPVGPVYWDGTKWVSSAPDKLAHCQHMAPTVLLKLLVGPPSAFIML